MALGELDSSEPQPVKVADSTTVRDRMAKEIGRFMPAILRGLGVQSAMKSHAGAGVGDGPATTALVPQGGESSHARFRGEVRVESHQGEQLHRASRGGSLQLVVAATRNLS